jgi:hypothetical protein
VYGQQRVDLKDILGALAGAAQSKKRQSNEGIQEIFLPWERYVHFWMHAGARRGM